MRRGNITDDYNSIATASTITVPLGEKLERDNITDDYNSRATASNLEKEDLPEIKSRAPTGERSDCATNKSVKNESTESYGVYQRETIEKNMMELHQCFVNNDEREISPEARILYKVGECTSRYRLVTLQNNSDKGLDSTSSSKKHVSNMRKRSN